MNKWSDELVEKTRGLVTGKDPFPYGKYLNLKNKNHQFAYLMRSEKPQGYILRIKNTGELYEVSSFEELLQKGWVVD